MEIFNQFGINGFLLAAQVVNFLVLLLILNKFLYKPVLKVLNERKEKVEESLKNADEIEQRLAQIAQKEEEILLKATREAEKIIKQAQDSGVLLIEEAKAKAEALGQKMIDDAKAQMQMEKEKMKQEINLGLADVVMVALQKVTGKVISNEDQKEMVRKTIGQM